MENVTIKDILSATGGRILKGQETAIIENISIDSRTMQGNDLFVPIIGERVDAHNYIEQAFKNGAAAAFTSRKLDDRVLNSPGKTVIEVSDTIKALQDLGAYYRLRYEIPVIGVTGSVGKTSMREMIGLALSASYQVFRTSGNLNSQVGVPITLSRLTHKDEIAVLELGMSEPGEMEVIAKIARPSMAVITNIGLAHIEQLGTQENICTEKLKIQEGLEAGGILFLNGDDKILRTKKARPGFHTIYFGTSDICEYRVVDIHEQNGFPAFRMVHKDERVSVELPVFGQHNILNAAAALAVSKENGVPMEKAALALKTYQGFGGRQQIYVKNGITIIDDSYNASPDSMKAGIEVLTSLLLPGKKIAVLADMLELGAESARYHYEVGEYLAKQKIHELVTIGLRAKEIAQAVKDHNVAIKVTVVNSNEEAASYLFHVLEAGDGVLFKGSHSMKLETIVKLFL